MTDDNLSSYADAEDYDFLENDVFQLNEAAAPVKAARYTERTPAQVAMVS